MKKTVLLPLIFLVLFVMIVGSACILTGGSEETKVPEVVYVTATSPAPVATLPPVATEPPAVATETPVVVIEPPVVVTEPPVVTEAPTEGPPDYFVEEFENGLGNYFYFLMQGNENYADVRAEDGLLKFDLTAYDLYYYLMYDPFTYGDVRIDAEVVNQGVNDNMVTFICRYDEDLGWYEFNVTSGGLWYIYYYDNVINKRYMTIADGGSTNVKMGRDTNTYSVVCKGRDLSLYINGVLTKSVQHKDLTRGYVGIGVSSFDATPVIMNIPWMEISAP